VENLTRDCPQAPDDIEKLMTETGLLQLRPDLMVN
jgi:hypothetical protein